MTDAPDCVITEGAPTALTETIPVVRGAAARVFGEANLAAFSPASYGASSYNSPILMGHLPDDMVVQASQMWNFATGRPSVTPWLATTDPGPPGENFEACLARMRSLDRAFTHMCYSPTADLQDGISAASMVEWRARERQFLALATRR